MRFIQTLYIHEGKDPFIDNFGWIRPEFHLMGWALSALQLYKFYGSVELYGNTQAIDLLINNLNLPYTKVHRSHDDFKLADEGLWALPKIYTYEIQESPFLHLDGDVFIFDKFSDNLLEQELISQNLETFTEDYYTKAMIEIIKYFNYFPSTVEKDFNSPEQSYALNAGILGGTNLSFFKEYTKEAFNYIDKNKEQFKYIDVNLFNVFFEQHLFFVMAKEKKIPIGYLLNSFEDNGYNGLGNFHEAPFDIKYLHLLGHFKRNQATCLQMASKLRSLYPEIFYNIIKLFYDKKIPIYSEFLKRNNSIEKDIYDLNIYKHQITNNYQNSIVERKVENTCIETLRDYLNTFENRDLSIENSFSLFIQSIDKTRVAFKEDYSDSYLNGRDLSAENWYGMIFEDESTIKSKEICVSEMFSIYNSDYDWGRFYRRFTSTGIEYYANAQLEKGNFYYIIINELFGDYFSIYDLDEWENIILKKLSNKMTISQLLLDMQFYIDDDILQNHMDAYETLILNFIKQLVLIKAVRPSIL